MSDREVADTENRTGRSTGTPDLSVLKQYGVDERALVQINSEPSWVIRYILVPSTVICEVVTHVVGELAVNCSVSFVAKDFPPDA